MKNNKFFYLLFVLLFYLAVGMGTTQPAWANESFAGGDGLSPETAFEIKTAAQLNNVRTVQETVYFFKLMNDINLVNYLSPGNEGYNDGAGWEPIGAYENPFIGHFDGNGHTIGDLTVDRPETDSVGLFGYSENGSFKNVSLVGADVKGGFSVGALVGHAEESSITDCSVSGSITGLFSVGGLVGENWGSINNCSVSGSVTGTGFVGGLAGNNVGSITGSNATAIVEASGDWRSNIGGLVGGSMGDITACYASGDVIGVEMVGGLAGNISGEAVIENSYATGLVKGSSLVGGLVGAGQGDSAIKSSYSAGNVTGVEHVGGLIGQNSVMVTNCYSKGRVKGEGSSTGIGGLAGFNNGNIINSYAVGAVAGLEYLGGLVGENKNGTVIASYYDSEATGQSDDAGKGMSKTTAEMQAAATFTEWDFANIWLMQEGITYPYLQGLVPPGFAAALAEAGDKSAGATFQLNIINAKGLQGYLNGIINATVTSNIEGKIYDGGISFTDGNGVLNINLTTVAEHTLTIKVAGITSEENLQVNVVVPPGAAKDIIAFGFAAADNNVLDQDVTAIIERTSITIIVPYGTDVTTLVADFTITGQSVKVGTVEQLSGVTANDFSYPAIYTVTALDGSTQNYTVTVTEFAVISYDITTPTTQPVTATVTFFLPDVVITNNQGKSTFTFTNNGSFIFNYIDGDGNEGSVTALMDWIDTGEPGGYLVYSTKELTNQDVTVTFVPYQPDATVITNNGGNKVYAFTENGSFTFEYTKPSGYATSTTASVDWIDKEPPTADIAYSTTEWINGEVSAHLENIWDNNGQGVMAEGGITSHTFHNNDSFTLH